MSAVVLGTMSIMGVFLIKRGKSTSVSIRYFTTVSQQMLTAIKYVMNDSFVFQQDSALERHACNTTTAGVQNSQLHFF